jgi:endonuclease YncB( thermonuclease family)
LLKKQFNYFSLILKYCILILTLSFGHLSIQKESDSIEQTLTGKAIKIVDGDTFDLLVGTVTYRIRLNGIDTPEKGQDFYQNAKNSLGNWCRNQTLRVTYKSKDRNGRLIGDLYTSSGIWVNLKLVEEGMAWHFKKYSSDKTLAAAEIKARSQKIGLWVMKNTIAPWDWRKGIRK